VTRGEHPRELHMPAASWEPGQRYGSTDFSSGKAV
jgi:hypothetical protein